ncbi:MAG: DNA-binding protein WhiA [Clostridia bacterium]
MTFAYEVKEEICSLKLKKEYRLIQIYGLLLFANQFTDKQIKIITENEIVANTILNDFEELFEFKPIFITHKTKVKTVYNIIIDNKDLINRISLVIGTSIGKLTSSINHNLVYNESSQSAFIRGAFLSGGTMATPTKAYHFEISTPKKALAYDFISLLSELEIAEPKIIMRKSNYVVYYKDSLVIEDILNIMGARKSEFNFINAKIEKQLRNDANRSTNCVTANISKAVEASSKQRLAIDNLKKSGRYELLPIELKKIAVLREENPFASLEEIALLTEDKESKTSIYNKLKKIQEF